MESLWAVRGFLLEFDVFFTTAVYQMPLGSSSCQKWKWILLQLRTLCMCDSKANLWFITVMKGTSGMLWWYGVHYKKSITNAYRSRYVWICSESSLWPNSVVWEKTLGLYTRGMPNCHPPLFASFSPFSPLPPPQSPLQDTSLYQSKRANPEAKPAFNLGLIVKASQSPASVRDIFLLLLLL